ncbi:sensor histidine kinase [Lysinibacillus antri]|uniref:histidine kinase n=1 Tax=Lysinibacillus antri TaxID=2498145 RepID=A0A432LEN2_9BACI|nr:sensor histidine kinase [Lysinibacillus antri]RUL54643.1 GHKL domain-containing protein [Lysinibacillus antri]
MVTHNFQNLYIYVLFFLSFMFICLFIYSYPKRKHPYLIYFSLFLVSISVNLLGVWQMPAAITYSSLIKYMSYGSSTFFFLFYEQIFGQGFKNINRRLWQFHLLCWFMISLLSMLSIVPLEGTFLPYSMLNIISILYVAIITIAKANYGNKEAIIFTFGLISLIITLMIDIFSAIKIANYAPIQTTSWGLLIFIGCLTSILLKRYLAKRTDFIYDPLIFYDDPIALKMKADSMVLHTLKNEINRLAYLNERNKRLLSATDITLKSPLEKNFEEMDVSLQHMNNMILAVKKTDDIVLNRRKLSFNSIIVEALTSFQEGRTNQTIKFVLDLTVPIDLEMDPVHIKECITNLLSNSVEAIEHPNGEIKIHLYQRHNEAILEVTDNGKGIHQDHINDVITPLYTTKKSVSHYGVGLYYVYFVINKHGGTLSIPFSKIGKGTTVRIQLPIRTNKKRFWSVNAFGKNKNYAR